LLNNTTNNTNWQKWPIETLKFVHIDKHTMTMAAAIAVAGILTLALLAAISLTNQASAQVIGGNGGTGGLGMPGGTPGKGGTGGTSGSNYRGADGSNFHGHNRP
jgi:hypothetical protein